MRGRVQTPALVRETQKPNRLRVREVFQARRER